MQKMKTRTEAIQEAELRVTNTLHDSVRDAIDLVNSYLYLIPLHGSVEVKIEGSLYRNIHRMKIVQTFTDEVKKVLANNGWTLTKISDSSAGKYILLTVQ